MTAAAGGTVPCFETHGLTKVYGAGHGAVHALRVVDGSAPATPVDVGHDNGLDAEILSGAEAGDTVVLYPGEQLADGVRVSARGS